MAGNKWSGRVDLNHRPPGPEPGALARLSHAPTRAGNLHFRRINKVSTAVQPVLPVRFWRISAYRAELYRIGTILTRHNGGRQRYSTPVAALLSQPIPLHVTVRGCN
jgi:hypothetical protein